jgi:hypothetical protein
MWATEFHRSQFLGETGDCRVRLMTVGIERQDPGEDGETAIEA